MKGALESTMSNGSPIAGQIERRVSRETVVRRDEPLAPRTTLRVGGAADVFVEPASEHDLAEVLGFCADRTLPFLVLGRGSNLLVRDGGFHGVVIALGHPQFSRIEVAGERLHCGAGARLKAVAVEARRAGVAGLEFLEGIPGSVGGALRMNAGAMGNATFDVVESVRMMDYAGNVLDLAPRDISFQYRHCSTLTRHLALAAVLKGRKEAPDAIARRMLEFSRKRWASQPAAPSAGCLFKNPDSIPAGRLIEELGLKGTRIGGASVSAEHGNFVVNDGSATARDVVELMELIQRRARAERGIELRTEVQIVGED